MAEDFVPLAMFLRPTPSAPEVVAPQPVTPAVIVSPECAQTIRAARRFRAALSDALEVAVHHLLREIARAVLARELRIEPADVAGVVRDALDRFADQPVIAIRAHPDDFDALRALEIEVLRDAGLQRGDVVLEVRSGTIDLRMETRVEAALSASAR